MPCHPRARQVINESDLPKSPTGDEHHTYYIHNNGEVFREESNAKVTPHHEHRGRNQEAPDVPHPQDEFCDEDRMTLIHLPSEQIVPLEDPDEAEMLHQSWPNSLSDSRMPHYLVDKLHNICSNCDCKKDILWKSFRRAESHFEACFRYADDKDDHTKRCFLKLYTFKVPFIAKRPLVLSMVYHIRAEGNSFIAARNGPSTNREHMFCLIAGFKVSDMTQMITRILSRWQDISDDHSHSGAGLTPKLFLAIVISQYGFMNSKDVVKAGLSLKGKYDIQLQACLKSLWGLSPDSIQRIHEDTKNIRDLNKVLINMNSNLTGTRSIMHYLSATSEILIDRITAFETYVESRLNEWDENPCARDLVLGLRDMDSFKETLRDTDKLQIVRKSMQQYMVDIDALHEQIDINISMVGNLIAEKDRAIQIHMAEQGNRDGSNMKIMAGLTAAFLPVTFMAVLLTTPMFKWDAQPGESVVVKLPTKIYWSASLSLSTLFAICLAALWRHRTSEDDKRHVAVQDEGEYALKDQGVQTVGTSRGSTPKEPKPVVKERSPSILEKGIAPPRSVEL